MHPDMGSRARNFRHGYPFDVRLGDINPIEASPRFEAFAGPLP